MLVVLDHPALVYGLATVLAASLAGYEFYCVTSIFILCEYGAYFLVMLKPSKEGKIYTEI